MLSKKLAGIGAVAALVGSALVPSAAFAASSDDVTNPPDVQAGVQITKNIVANDNIDVAGDVYTFNIAPDACDSGTHAKDTACRDAADYPGLSSNSVTATFAAGETTKTVNFPLPEATAFAQGGPGIYVWKVTEADSGAKAPHVVDYSAAEYRVKAYVVKNADTGALEYKAVTIAQDVKDLPADDVTENNKKDKMTFTNIYEDVTTFEVEKKVINNAGLPEADSYDFTVEFTWPANFNGTTRTGHSPVIAVGGDATDANCTAGTDKTTCTFKLAKDKKASFSNVPVGATYTVAETVPSGANYELKSISSTGEKVPAAGASSTVTNEYDDITPTGIALAVLPYVLMIGIPLLAIGGYIALRRKMNL